MNREYPHCSVSDLRNPSYLRSGESKSQARLPSFPVRCPHWPYTRPPPSQRGVQSGEKVELPGGRTRTVCSGDRRNFWRILLLEQKSIGRGQLIVSQKCQYVFRTFLGLFGLHPDSLGKIV